MAAEVRMPKLGATMERATIAKWFKREGEKVEVGEPLVEVMTDKVNIEIEAEVAGTLLKVHFQPDQEVVVNQVIAFIGESNKIRRTPAAKKMAYLHHIDLHQVQGTGLKGCIHLKDVVRAVEASKTQIKDIVRTVEASKTQINVTPLARKIAEDRQVDLSEIKGSGVNGKIIRDDIMNLTQKVPIEAEKIKLEGMRKVIADRMTQSAFSAPHVTLVSEVDMSNAITLRNQLLPLIEKQTGYRLSYTEIIIKVVAHALRKHPKINASLRDGYIIMNPHVNIGLAVSVPNGLMVPVVKDADQKGLESLTAECKTLGQLSREGKLQPEQLNGGTFTISNLGMYAVDAFTPIINQPESAILGIGRINERAVGIDGSIVLRRMLTLSLSFDHRVMDGAPAAVFLTDIKEFLENPYQLLL